MSYRRVIPRDLFNEANLLKCLGRLAILIDEMRLPAHFLNDAVVDFGVTQNPADGSIYSEALPLIVRGTEPYRLYRPLNSRQPWPLWLDHNDEAIQVFDDEGHLTVEFTKFIFGNKR